MNKSVELPKINKRFEVFNKAEKEEAVLYMYGSIGSGWFADISSKEVKYQLSKIDAKTIKVHINSPGGDVFESIAIHNLFKNHKAKIHVYIDGLAASGASVIAMAADKIIMPKNTMMMIHRAWTFTYGNAEQLRKVANDLDKIDIAVTESYTDRFVGERSELEDLLGEESWLTAEECLALGFADELSDEIEIQEEEEETEEISAKDRVLNKYLKNVSSQHKEHEKPPTTESPKVTNNANMVYQFLNTLARSSE